MLPAAEHGVAKAFGLTLTDIVDLAQLRGLVHGGELLLVPLGPERGLQRRSRVEVILHRLLVAAGDHQDVIETGTCGLGHHVLDGGLVHHGEHLFGHGLGGRQEARAETGRGDDSFADGSPRTHEVTLAH